MSEHLAIIQPDERGRFNLRRFLGRESARYKLYVEQGGRRIVLEATDIEDQA